MPPSAPSYLSSPASLLPSPPDSLRLPPPLSRFISFPPLIAPISIRSQHTKQNQNQDQDQDQAQDQAQGRDQNQHQNQNQNPQNSSLLLDALQNDCGLKQSPSDFVSLTVAEKRPVLQCVLKKQSECTLEKLRSLALLHTGCYIPNRFGQSLTLKVLSAHTCSELCPVK